MNSEARVAVVNCIAGKMNANSSPNNAPVIRPGTSVPSRSNNWMPRYQHHASTMKNPPEMRIAT